MKNEIAQKACLKIMGILDEYANCLADKKFILLIVKDELIYEAVKKSLEIEYVLTPRKEEFVEREIKRRLLESREREK